MSIQTVARFEHLEFDKNIMILLLFNFITNIGRMLQNILTFFIVYYRFI